LIAVHFERPSPAPGQAAEFGELMIMDGSAGRHY
jgi:hypothetical protein